MVNARVVCGNEPLVIAGSKRCFAIPQLDRERRVWLYLPPDYDRSAERYPVLYMHDGQNVFDAATSFAGEWEMDETCERLIAEGDIEPLVVVAVDNAGAGRIDEYTPWPAPDGRGGGGAAHLEAIVEVLLPWVRDQYRAMAERHVHFFSQIDECRIVAAVDVSEERVKAFCAEHGIAARKGRCQFRRADELAPVVRAARQPPQHIFGADHCQCEGLRLQDHA